MTGPLVEIVKATKVYPPDIVAIQNISLTVAKGEILFLTGMSGAGKTTLLKLICAIEKATKGVIEVAGLDLAHTGPADIQRMRRQIGVVYQDFKILPKHTRFPEYRHAHGGDLSRSQGNPPAGRRIA